MSVRGCSSPDMSEREEIRAGLSAKMSIRAIATALNRSPSTISREVQVIGATYYKAVDANNRATEWRKGKTVLTGSKFTIAACSGKAGDEMVSRANIRMVKANKTTSKTLRISPETIYKTLTFVAVKRYTT